MAFQSIGQQVFGSSNVQFPPGGSKAACRHQNTSAYPVAITTLYGYWEFGGGNVKGVVYSDNSGSPDALLGVTAGVAIPGILGDWVPLQLSAPVVIAAGAYVWLGVISATTMSTARCLATGSILYNTDSYSSPASTFGAASTAAFTYPLFAVGDDGTMRLGRASVDQDAAGFYYANAAHADKFTLGGTGSVSVASISTFVTTTSGTVKSKAALYTDASGAPGTLIAQTAEVVGSTANTWLTLNFASPPTLAPGTYWVCFIADTSLGTPLIAVTGYLRNDNTSGGTVTESAAWPATMPGLPLNNAPRGIDIYASYSLVVASVARPRIFVCT